MGLSTRMDTDTSNRRTFGTVRRNDVVMFCMILALVTLSLVYSSFSMVGLIPVLDDFGFQEPQNQIVTNAPIPILVAAAARNEGAETVSAAAAKTAATATATETAVENEGEADAGESVQRTHKKEAAPLVAAVTQPANQVGAAVPPSDDTKSSIVNVLELSKTYQDEPSNITAAICAKTLFGDIDLGIVLQWVAYHRLMGFDHVFIFYRPEITSKPRFTELASLPYVTLMEYSKGYLKTHWNQKKTENMCLSEKRFAADYDWAMLADADEFLWFPERRGIKPFLAQQQARNLTYLSFGKQMYTMKHRVDFAAHEYALDTKDMSHFPLSKFPFYIKNFCYGKRRGEPLCPTWKGRAKVIVKPKHHQNIDVHGNIFHPDPAKGTIHFHPDTAHFMEWPYIFGVRNITLQEKKSFQFQSESQVGIHNLERAFKSDAGGNFTMQYDRQLEDWFQYVIGRGTSHQGQQPGQPLK
jgi:hypothetical protein